MNRFALGLIFIWLPMTLAGCVSYRSTIMSRLPNDQFVRNSQQCTRGVPVTLKVPTHVDVRIVEEYFVVQGGGQTAIPQIGKSLRRVEMETVYTPKVMTVDFVRPAAGTLNLGTDSDGNGISMDDAGYFESIQGKIDDRTLEDLNKSIPNFKSLLSTSSGKKAAAVAAKGKNTELGGWHAYDSIIAIRRFDINEPGWEMHVDQFVNEHLQCQSAPCAPDCPAPSFEVTHSVASQR